jgi:MerR family transcriptional regulator, copper efflux regulator
MKIGDLAHLTGLATSAIRFYEQRGLLPAAERSANGYRSYGEAALERLRTIQLAQQLGFSLDTLREVFGGTEALDKTDVLHTLDTRLAEIDQLLGALRQQREQLHSVRKTLQHSWDQGGCVDLSTLMAPSPGPAPVAGTPVARPAAARTLRHAR